MNLLALLRGVLEYYLSRTSDWFAGLRRKPGRVVLMTLCILGLAIAIVLLTR